MNLLNFIQAGGFPMDTNVLDQMQNAYKVFNALGALAGNRAIIQGCMLTDSTVSNGVIYLNGEILEFRGGIVEANVIVIQEVESKEFENGTNNEVHYTRYATFGAGTAQYPWSSFKRGFSTTEIAEALELKEDKTSLVSIDNRITQLEKKNAVFQSGGGMVLWNKPANQIPTGWAEVVDWRGRMPVGFDSAQTEFNAMGKQDGSKSTTLVKANIPALDLTLPASNAENSGGDFRYVNATNVEYGGEKVYAGAVNKGNSATSINILNPYRTVLFIEYTA